jgi:hypothetical protein
VHSLSLFYSARAATAVLDSSDPDLLRILKEMANQICDESLCNSLPGDTDVQDFIMLLCQSIDARNILTPAELSE